MADVLGSLLNPKRGEPGPRKDKGKDDIPGQRPGASLPIIDVGDKPLRVKTGEALGSLCKHNDPPTIFTRSGAVVRIERDETGLPRIKEMSEAAFRGELARCADFMLITQTRDGERARHVSPPLDVVRDAMTVRTSPFPPLIGITESPVIRPDGRIVSSQGYDADTRLYYAPSPGFVLPPVPREPTAEDVAKAMEAIDDVICDFPFEDAASRANAIAAMITPALRPLINGNAPLALIDKPQAGTGATLLAEVVAMVTTGRKAAPMTAPEDDAAWRKAITSQLLGGTTVIVVDNLEGRLWAPSLAAILTTSTWQDRILGRSEMVTLPHHATWMATGNNISLGGDLPRRCYWVRMDARVAKPWQRDGFRHPRLLQYVEGQRATIAAAILTLGRAWIQGGAPENDALPTLGSFENWTRVIGGILHMAGADGFLANLDALYEQADEDGPPWEAFLEVWNETWPNEAVTTKDIRDATVSVKDAGPEKEALANALPDHLGSPEDRSFTRKLGNALSKREKRRYPNDLLVARAGTHKRAVRWKVFRNGEFDDTATEDKGDDGGSAYKEGDPPPF